ncbi:hypothetical protein CO666_25260 [Rhizobium chutanense]|uniref:Uncharacterized protein n=1 Tax=Rhizobium chutanense TaxID=2035448 RepID=A0A2A6J651_9HYPH|nr:hypothetical protein [Rhizobium chutanense]PDT01410.1 hypothetical protein CO666_25260 [Rhizobium chutanense]
MTDIVDDNLTQSASALKVKVPVKTGHGDEKVIELDLGDRVTIILDLIASERGCSVEELILIREGDEEPITEVVVVNSDYPHKRRHHVHHAGEVVVTVYYQAREETRGFKRSATVEAVLAWAIKVFNIDPNMATEFELTRHGERQELPGSEHVGHLAGRHRELALDLVRGDIANGAST